MPNDFAAECEAAAKSLRRVPTELRRALSREVKTQVAEPLANRIRSQAGQTGPWGHILARGTKARAGADPTIVVGGLSPKLSGGGGPRHVVFGTEWGGGKRLSRVPSRAGRRGYRRYSTNQFRRARPFVFPTINQNMDATLEAFADITMTVLEKVE